MLRTDMGSAGSRRKKVAPAAEVNVRERSSSRRARGDPITRTSHANGTGRKVRSELHSDGQDSDFSAEDENLTEDKPIRRASQTPFFKSYGLCYGKSDPEQDDNFTEEGLREDHLNITTLEKNQTCLLHKPCQNDQEKESAGTTGSLDPSSKTTAVVSGNCHHPSMILSVFYDASEEDLMNTIEREFG